MKEQIKPLLLVVLSLALLSAAMCSVALLPYAEASPQPTTVTATPTTTLPGTTARPTTGDPIVTTTAAPTVPPTTTASPTVPTTTVPPTTVPATTPPTVTVPTTAPTVTVPTTTVPAVPTPSSTLDALHAFVYRCDDDLLLCAKGPMTERLHPASITKLFTVYIALQYLEPSRQVTAGTILNTVPDDASVADLQIGDILTVEQLIAAMLLPSGNDAAMVLAVEAGRVVTGDAALSESAALAAFVTEMNRQTEVLGLQNSHFTCPDGYADSGHYTCMADVLTITRLCIQIPLVCELTATSKYELTLPSGRILTWSNTNWLVRKELGDYYNPYCVGLKTGFMSAAGYCLMSVFQVDGQELIIGTFGCSSIRARFDDTLKLFNEFA